MTALTEYIAAWVAQDPERIAMVVQDDCIITECYGPVYHGRAQVRQWAETWFARGGLIHDWQITDHFVAGDREAAQWTFECTWEGNRASFDGASIARTRDGKILELREYETSAPLYDWMGTWR